MSWRRLSRRLAFDNPWISVYEDRVVNPGGGENQYGLVHFKNVAVAIVPLARNGDTWLVGQSRYPLGNYSWELPMGGAPLAEAPADAAARELREETGLSAGNWQELMRLHTSNSITDEHAIVYIARDLAEGETAFEETEDLTVRRLPYSEALEMVLSGGITDAISVAAILRVRDLVQDDSSAVTT